jgi:hypothetical protein
VRIDILQVASLAQALCHTGSGQDKHARLPLLAIMLIPQRSREIAESSQDAVVAILEALHSLGSEREDPAWVPDGSARQPASRTDG